MNGKNGRFQKSYFPSCQKITLGNETAAPHSPLQKPAPVTGNKQAAEELPTPLFKTFAVPSAGDR